MGNILKMVDTIVFLFFLLMAIFAPFLDAQYCLPQEYQPKFLIDFSSWCSTELDYYLVVDKPSFYVGLAWMELFVSWPLSIINLFAIIYDKSWFHTTCLIHGVCLTTSMVAILSELIGSGKASDKLKMIYYSFMAISLLIAFRGLLSSFYEIRAFGKKSFSTARYKRA